MKRKFTVAICGLVCLALLLSHGQTEPPQAKRPAADKTELLMQTKLRHAQALLRGIAVEDFDALEESAGTLAALTMNAAWQQQRSEEYRRFSTEMERAAYLLAATAKQQNIAGATLAFLDISHSCVDCHKYLRKLDNEAVIQFDYPKPLPGDDKDFSIWMKRKLQFSQKALAALVLGDFDELADAARAMETLSKVEGWARRADADRYRTQLEFFRQTNENLRKQAGKRDLDESALAFTQLTLSCVNCHRALRDDKPVESP